MCRDLLSGNYPILEIFSGQWFLIGLSLWFEACPTNGHNEVTSDENVDGSFLFLPVATAPFPHETRCANRAANCTCATSVYGSGDRHPCLHHETTHSPNAKSTGPSFIAARYRYTLTMAVVNNGWSVVCRPQALVPRLRALLPRRNS